MNRITLSLIAVLAPFALGCQGDGNYHPAADAAPDLALPPQVTHVGIDAPTCCIDPAPNAARVLYIANPKPQSVDLRGNDRPTRGELHLADAYGFDTVLAKNVPRNSYAFTPAGEYVMYLDASTTGDDTFSLKFAPLPSGTLGPITPITVVPRGMQYLPLNQQAFFSATGRYLLTGTTAPNIANSADLTVIDVATARVVFTLPNGSFDYLESLTSNDTMVFQDSIASHTVGTPSVQGLFVLPLAAAASGGKPALIEEHVTQFALSPDERKVVYTTSDGNLWMYGLKDQSKVQIGSDVAKFQFLFASANGPLVTIKNDNSLHIAELLHPEIVTTGPNFVDVWTTFTLAPDSQSAYFFDKTQNQDNAGDLWNIALKSDGTVTTQATFVDRRVSIFDLQFGYGRMRYIRNVDGRGDTGDLTLADLDGKNPHTIAEGVALGSIAQANPLEPQPTAPKGNPVRGAQDFQAPVIPPVFVQLVDAFRDTKPNGNLIFDDSEPILGKLGFARNNGTPIIVDPNVHVGGYSFSPDGYSLLYAGGVKYNSKLRAYLGTLQLYQTLIDQNPTIPVLDGVAQLGPIHGRELFVAAPGAMPAGTYYVRY